METYDGLFDRIVGRDLTRSKGDDETWILEHQEIRPYLPSLLRLLRDADNSNDVSWGQDDESAQVIDKLMEIAVRYPMADAIEEYLCVSSEVGKIARRGGAQHSSQQCIPDLKGEGEGSSGSSSGGAAAGAGMMAIDDETTQQCTVLRFESGTAEERARLVLGEVIRLVQGLARGGGGGGAETTTLRREAIASDAADLLDRTSFQHELGCLLPLLMMYAPGLSICAVTEALLLNSKLAPAHLQVLVQNEPLCLTGVIKGVAMAMQSLKRGGSLCTTSRRKIVHKRAQDVCTRLASLSSATSEEIRAQLKIRKQLPEVCVWMSLSSGDLPFFIYSLIGKGAMADAVSASSSSPSSSSISESPHEWFWEWTARLRSHHHDADAVAGDDDDTGAGRGGEGGEGALLLPGLSTLADLIEVLWRGSGSKRGKGREPKEEEDPTELVAVRIKATAAVLCFSSQLLPWSCLEVAWKGIMGSMDDGDGPLGLLGMLFVGVHTRRNNEAEGGDGRSEADEIIKQNLKDEVLRQEEGKISSRKIMAIYLVLLLGGGKIDQVMGILSQVHEVPLLPGCTGGMEHMRPGLEALANLIEVARLDDDGKNPNNTVFSEGGLTKLVLSLPFSLWVVHGRRTSSSSEPTALACLYEAMTQGILTKQKVDLRESISDLLHSKPPPAAASSSLNVDPWALTLMMEYSSACCMEHTPLPPHPKTFIMQPLLPSEVKLLLAPLLAFSTPSSIRPSGAGASAYDILFPLTSEGGRRRHRRGYSSSNNGSSLSFFLRGSDPCQQPEEEGGGQSYAHAQYAGLLALVFALHFTKESYRHCGPFAPVFDYDLYSLPMPHILTLTRHYALASRGNCTNRRIEAWDQLYEKMMGLTLDHFPELHPAETLVGGEVGGLLPTSSSLSFLSNNGSTEGGKEEDFMDAQRQVLEDLKALLMQGPEGWSHHLGGPEDVGKRWLILHTQSSDPGLFEKQTLEVLLEKATIEEAGPGIMPLNREGACQEPLLVLRSPPWVFTTPGLLRIALTLLRSLIAASRLQAARASSMNSWKTELLAMRGRNNNTHSTDPYQASPRLSATPAPNGGNVPSEDEVYLSASQLQQSTCSMMGGTSASDHRPPPLPQQAMIDGSTMIVLQEAIIVKCLLSACVLEPLPSPAEKTNAVLAMERMDDGTMIATPSAKRKTMNTGTATTVVAIPKHDVEVRHEVCLFIQHLLSNDSRALTVLVHRGLTVSEMCILMDGVPALYACKSMLGGLLRGSSLAAHSRGLAFIVEYARRYPVDECARAGRNAVNGILEMLGPVVCHVCYSEGEDVTAAIKSIGHSIVSLVGCFPGLRGPMLEILRRTLEGKEMMELRAMSSKGGGGGKGGVMMSPAMGGEMKEGGAGGAHYAQLLSGGTSSNFADQVPGLLDKAFGILQQSPAPE